MALTLALASAARVLRVSGGGGEDGPACGDDAAPCATLAHAIGARAAPGDELVLLSGVHAGPGNRMIEWPDALTGVTVRSETGDPASTIVDLEYLGMFINFQSDPEVNFQDFTIRRGASLDPVEGSSAGGVFRIIGSSPVFSRMIFRDCFLQGSGFMSKGSVAYISDGSPTFTDCTFENNVAGIAGTLYIEGSNITAPRFVRSSFLNSGCKSGGWGGVVVPEGYSRSVFEDCFFANCSGTFGGCVDDGDAAYTRFYRTIFQGGRALRGGTYYGFGLAVTEFHDCIFEHSFAEENGGVAFTSTSVRSTFNNCVFRDSSAVADGGLLNIKDNSDVRIINSTLLNGRSNQGGCMLANSVTAITLIGSTLTCSAENGGGGALISAGEIVATDVSFRGGASRTGAAVLLTIDGKMTCTRCHFEDNHAEDGGAIGTSYGDLELKLIDSTCTSNVADRYGGCLYSVSPHAIISIVGSSIDSNRALGGAGIYVDVSSAVNAQYTIRNSSISDNVGQKEGIGRYLQTATSGAGLFVKDALSLIQPAACSFGKRAVLGGVRFAGNVASIGGGIYWSINGDQKCNVSQMCSACHFESNQASGYGNDVASGVAAVVVEGALPKPYPGEVFEIVAKGMDMFGSQLQGDHEQVLVLLDKTQDSPNDHTKWPVGAFMTNGEAKLRGLTIYSDEGSSLNLLLTSDPPVSYDVPSLLNMQLEACRPGAYFDAEYGCREPRGVENYQVVSNIMAVTAYKGGCGPAPPDVVQNLTLRMKGDDDAETTVVIDGAGGNESLPKWLEPETPSTVIGSESTYAYIAFRFISSGLRAGTYMSTVQLTIITAAARTPFLVPTQLVVTAVPVGSMSIWGRASLSLGALVCARDRNESVPLFLNVLDAPAQGLDFTACDRDGLPMINAQSYIDNFHALLVRSTEPHLEIYPEIRFSDPTNGLFALLAEPPTPGEWALNLTFSDSDGNTEQVGASRTIFLACAPDQVVMTDGVSCGCAPQYEPAGQDNVCAPCPSFLTKDVAGNGTCKLPTWEIVTLATLGALVLLALCGFQEFRRLRRERRDQAALLRIGVEKARVVVNGRKSPFPVLKLNTGERWHLFLSHVWFSGQDSVTVIKQQTTRMLPGFKVFQDIDDLDDLANLEQYVEASTSVLIFCSLGYFESKNCVREARKAVASSKPLVLVHEVDSSKGGVSFDAFVGQCPADLRQPIFDSDHPVVQWHRMPHLRMVICKIIIEHVLLHTPAYSNQNELDLYSNDSLDAFLWRLPEPILLTYSGANSGVMGAIQMLCSAITNEDGIKHMEIGGDGRSDLKHFSSKIAQWVQVRNEQQDAPMQRKKYFLLYLCKDIFKGSNSERLCDDIKTAQTSGYKFVILHEQRPEFGACDFTHFLASAPRDLINSNIFQQIAMPIYGGEFQVTSFLLAVQALGAKPHVLRRRRSHAHRHNLQYSGRSFAEGSFPKVPASANGSHSSSPTIYPASHSSSPSFRLSKVKWLSLKVRHSQRSNPASFAGSSLSVNCDQSGNGLPVATRSLSPARFNRQANVIRVVNWQLTS